MSIREKLNRYQGLVVLVVIIAVAVAIYAVYSQVSSGQPNQGNAWFTTDDGATWFRGDLVKNRPPFDHGGKEAVLAYVYTCPDGKEFVGLMERYNPQAKALFDKAKANPNSVTPQEIEQLGMIDFQKEWRRPGEKEWTRAGQRLPEFKCADGTVAAYRSAQ